MTKPNNQKDNWLKIIPALLLIGGLWDNPYIYFQVLRWVVTLVGIYIIYRNKNVKNSIWIIIFSIISILFNPIFPITLSRDTWLVIDTVTALIFIASAYFEQDLQKYWEGITKEDEESPTDIKDISDEDLIKYWELFKSSDAIPKDEPNYELARKVFMVFNDFNLKNMDSLGMIYLDYVPRSLLPYPKNYIKAAYYIFLEKLAKDKVDVKMFNNVQEIGTLLFANYPNYETYEKKLKRKSELDEALKEHNWREKFKEMYGVYSVSKEDYYSSPVAADATKEKIIHDFGVMPEIEDDIDFDKIASESNLPKRGLGKSKPLKDVLKLISTGDKIVVRSLDGTRTIQSSQEMFPNIFSDYLDHKIDSHIQATKETEVLVYDTVKESKIYDMFNSLDRDFEEMCLTQNQILEFIDKYKDYKIPPDKHVVYMFLFKVKDAVFCSQICLSVKKSFPKWFDGLLEEGSGSEYPADGSFRVVVPRNEQ